VLSVTATATHCAGRDIRIEKGTYDSGEVYPGKQVSFPVSSIPSVHRAPCQKSEGRR
jgi:hypothetical protein